MAHPYHHALSSAKKWGGVADDYLSLHSWFDESKSIIADFRHRALRALTAPCTRSSLAFAYFLRVGRYCHAADTLSELSEYFFNVRDGLGLPSSRMPKGYVYRRGDKEPFAQFLQRPHLGGTRRCRRRHLAPRQSRDIERKPMTIPTRAQGYFQPMRNTLQPRWFKRFKMPP